MTNATGMNGPAPSEGLILQRGGEELLLEKGRDRFTTQLTDPDAIAVLESILQPRSRHPVAQGQLVVWEVEPERLETTLEQARSLEAVQFASHVYRLVASSQTWVYLTDQITVQFTPTLTRPEQGAITEPLGLVLDHPLLGISNTAVYRVGPTATANPIKLANRLMAHSVVLTAEPNVVVATEGLYRPVDTLYSQQWHLATSGGNEVLADAHISVERAWDITRGTRSVVIAIADDGFDLNHPDLQGRGKLVAPRDLKSRNAVPLPMGTDENHGTACAGLAIGEENQSGIVGVAPGCGFMPIRTTGYLDDTSIEMLFDWVITQGAAVVSCSWSPAAVYFPLSLRQRHALTRAATQGRDGKGCVVLFSAGNANRPVSGTVQEQGWPPNTLRGSTTWLSGFAVHPDAIAVSACTSLNRKAAYSNWGTHIAVSAPSNNAAPSMALPQVGSVATGPTINQRLPGRGMVTSDRLDDRGYDRGAFTHTFGGTSSACPVAAGVAGLVLSANPDLTAREVRQILEQTADKITDANPDPQLGNRYGSYDQNGHSQWFGYGRVNAYRAVAEARRRAWSRGTSGQQVTPRDEAAVGIPDNRATPLVRMLAVTGSGTVQDVRVDVAIDHEYLGDLTLALSSPAGKTVTIQGRTLSNQQQLRSHYDLATTPALRWFLGGAAAGTWQLRVVDHAPGHTGRLQWWQLTLTLG
ncbi:S8 family serine peptidase [Leptolyngbya sp. PCC 6406]|uniref:S8 family serine peptidase n=1 Tax=Leptolyngbya sp. PCC 6406 TaxID=1173264 RepID=UPI0002ACFEF0|nr:S8 family serine peptidase [Leptolyngbya sp. PCC 6406]